MLHASGIIFVDVRHGALVAKQGMDVEYKYAVFSCVQGNDMNNYNHFGKALSIILVVCLFMEQHSGILLKATSDS